jgi:hypothetical protein
VLLLPAIYCSWVALKSSLRLTTNGPTFYRYYETTNPHTTSKVPLLATKTISRDKCFGLNSYSWLTAPKLDNRNETELVSFFNNDDDDASSVGTITPFYRLEAMLNESFCDEGSPLLRSFHSSKDDRREVHWWTIRLLYAAIHNHQHRPALAEFRQRQNCTSNIQQHSIGSFDYECPTAKFLLVSFYKNGIGANLRLAAVPALMAGLATDRVVLFVNDADAGPAFLQQTWTLASCDRRRDAQCFFRPATPCVLTHSELENSYQLTRGEMRRMFRFGTVPESRQEDRALIVHLSFRPQREPETLKQILYNKARSFADDLLRSTPNLSVSLEVLDQATKAILHAETELDFSYYGVSSPIFHSLLIYAMRPNPKFARSMGSVLRQVLPNDFSTMHALGLPIRGTI